MIRYLPSVRLSSPPGSPASRHPIDVVSTVAVFALTLTYRLSTLRFHNDHFDPLSKAQQILAGERPGVDFLDFGRPLTLYLSAAVQWSLGHTLLGEAILTTVALSLSVAIVFAVTTGLTGSRVAGAGAAWLVVALEPRLYNYPKLLTAAVAVWLVWRFAGRRGLGWSLALGAWTGVSFLLRHDLGVFVGLTGLVAVAGVPGARPQGVGRLARDAVVLGSSAAVVVAPYLWSLFQAGLLAPAGSSGLGTLAGAADLSLRPFDLRWERPQAPWLASAYNAETWIHLLFVLALPLAALLVFVGRRRGTLPGRTSATIAATIALGFLFDLFLIRGNLDSRLPDVVVPAAILLAFVAAGLLRLLNPYRAWLVKAVAYLAMAIVALFTWGSITVVGLEEPFRRMGAAIRDAPSRVPDTLDWLRAKPIDRFAPPGSVGIAGLTRWIHECTNPDDRILVVGYRPEVFYLAERRFAGGIAFFQGGYFSDEGSRRRIVRTLAGEAVPIVIVEVSEGAALEGTLGGYVATRFATAAESAFGGTTPFRVLIDRNRRPSSESRFASLPCFAGG